MRQKNTASAHYTLSPPPCRAKKKVKLVPSIVPKAFYTRISHIF